MTCTPSNLALSAKCFCGIPRRDSRAILIYALCLVAQVGLAKGFRYKPESAIIQWQDSGGAKSGNLATFRATADVPSVSFIDADSLGLTSISNISSLPALATLSCAGNSLTSLSVSGCPALINLYCQQNNITSLTIGGLTTLVDLRCQQNAITALDLTGCSSLQLLRCYSNQLGTLNITGCFAITTMWTYNNPTLVVVGP